MSKRPWFPFYTADFLRKTDHLSAEECGGYIRLMRHYWDNNGYLLFDPPGLCRIMGIERRRFDKVWKSLRTFFVLQSGPCGEKKIGDSEYTLLLPRLQEELEKAIIISIAKVEAGKKGGQASAAARTQAENKQQPTHSHSHTHKDKKREKKPRKKRATSLPENWKLPDDYKAYCIEKRPDLNPDLVAENFKDYYLSHGKTMVDWKRTWQRWVRDERGKPADKYTKPDVQSESHKTVDFDKPSFIAPGIPNDYSDQA